MSAGTLNIYVEQGATWERVFTYRDSDDELIPLTGWSARMQIRKSYKTAMAAVSLTSDVSGGIEIDDPGVINVTITDEQTAAIDFTSGVWDLEILDGTGRVFRLLQGSVTISPEVTR